jgi:hypothetical protein
MQVAFKHSQLIGPDDECPLTGTVTVEVPPYYERKNLLIECGISEYRAVQNESEDSKIQNAVKLSAVASKAAEIVLKRVVKCNLRGPDDLVITTAEEFVCHPDCTPLVEGLVERFLSNFASPKKKPSSTAT